MKIKISDNVIIGEKLTLIGGPCVVESLDMCKKICSYLQELCAELDVQYMFKASLTKPIAPVLNLFVDRVLMKA